MGVCALNSRCHVAGKGLTKFGTKFSEATVLDLVSSSVLIVDVGNNLQVASGVLIAKNVVICAAHSIPSLGSNTQGILFYECDAKTAPAAPTSKGPPLPPCTLLNTTPQLKLGKVLENGQSYGLDYALLEATWLSNSVTFPRKVSIPTPDYFYGGELLATGHPITSHKADGTQASAGSHLSQAMHGPHPDPQTNEEKNAQEYTYADFVTATGMSGGGVFNEKGKLVGIVTGYRRTATANEYGFLNIGLVAGKSVTSGGATKLASERLKNWMGGSLPLLSSDPQPSNSVTTSPPL